MIPFLDLRAQYAAIQAEVDAAIAGVFASGRFILPIAVAVVLRKLIGAFRKKRISRIGVTRSCRVHFVWYLFI